VRRDALRWLDRLYGPPSQSDLAELEAAGWLTRKVVGRMLERQEPGAKLSEAFRGFRAHRRTLDHLVSSGTLAPRPRRLPRFLSAQRYDVAPAAGRDQRVADLRAVLLDRREPDPRSAHLLGLLGAANLFASTLNGSAHLARWAPRPQRSEADARAKELADLAWGDEHVSTALTAAGAVIQERNARSASSGS
jgi:hypothetical protein